MTDSAPKTAPVVILGRTITVTRPNETQLTLMHRFGTITSQSLAKALRTQDEAEQLTDEAAREAALEKADPDFDTGMRSMSEMLEILEFLVSEEDRLFLIRSMKAGMVEIKDLFAFVDAFRKKGAGGGTKKVAKRVAE